VAKLLKRVVATQLISHVEGNVLYSPVQLAYRSHHSTEMALLKIGNDVLLDVNKGDAVLLALLDLGASVDTVDHTVLPSQARNADSFSSFRSLLKTVLFRAAFLT
jgi:hypothetical protein